MVEDEFSDEAIIGTVLESLEVAVLAREALGSAGGCENGNGVAAGHEAGDDVGKARRNGFRLIGPEPAWFSACFGSARDALGRSAFLEDFVSGPAGDCWSAEGAEGADGVSSGIWEESTAGGMPRYFEARALKCGLEEILVIALADERHRRERAYVQHAHDEALQQRRLAREREKKDILLDCIVHDLSSPLSTILMNIQHVSRQVDRDDLRQSLIRAETQAERQRSLIRSIADMFEKDLSVLEAALLGRDEGVDIAAVAGEMVDAHQAGAQKRRIHLELEVDGDRDMRYRVGEAGHLERVFDNLLHNAVRQSPDGGTVSVRIRLEGERIVSTVDDEGPGIPEEERERIFVPLAARIREGTTGMAGDKAGEGDSGEDDSGRGHSLGLYFCKMTVELWGGVIGMDSRPGGGNRCWFDLPQSRKISAKASSGGGKGNP
jgi:signal transduction histidine kinase